jgi:hypothetical protein
MMIGLRTSRMIGPSPLFGYAPSALTTTNRRIWVDDRHLMTVRQSLGDNFVADASGGAENRDSHGALQFDLGE